MIIDDISNRYPKLYHMADKRNWENIKKFGLLSTKALLDKFGIKGSERFRIESQLRSKEIPISHTRYGTVIIRDQSPMRDRPSDGVTMEGCLDGITLAEWFEYLNERVFFWTDREGLRRMLGAANYRSTSHYVFVVDTRSLLIQHSSGVTLSSINSGSLYGQNAKIRRSPDTFRPLSYFPKMAKVWELAVGGQVPDIFEVAVSVHECISFYDRNRGEKSFKDIKTIWEKS